jgi:hypothetical protein
VDFNIAEEGGLGKAFVELDFIDNTKCEDDVHFTLLKCTLKYFDKKSLKGFI